MGAEAFKAARDFLLAHRADYHVAVKQFRWPELQTFNWALDWFDGELARGPLRDRPALRILGEHAEDVTFGEISARSNRIANGLARRGVRKGDRLLLMLGNVAPLWETMLAAMKLGAVIIPSTLLLTADDLAERVRRARVRHLVVPASETPKFAGLDSAIGRFCTGDPPAGWTRFDDLRDAPASFTPEAATDADDPLLLYFTSGTTSKPKMVLHSHRSYPIGHLSTMYWVGAQPGDLHMAMGAPGWAGHTFVTLFAPWNAGATVMTLNQPRFDARTVLDTLVKEQVNSFFAPPTVWRMLLQLNLSEWRVVLREAVAAGEPLNPEVIEQVRRAWGLTVRDGWGQTELCVQVANSPGVQVNVGTLGRVMPGCSITVLDPEGNETDEGELSIPMSISPPGLMAGYLQDDESIRRVEGEFYRTGDAVKRNDDGTYTYIGRVDDVFKSSDYRISPFELESVLIEHPAVVEAAVVPSPDPVRLAVPKAFIALSASHGPNRETAASIFQHSRARLAPYKRIRRITFADLPKTVSGKIRRVELRQSEANRSSRMEDEYREEDVLDIA